MHLVAVALLPSALKRNIYKIDRALFIFRAFQLLYRELQNLSGVVFLFERYNYFIESYRIYRALFTFSSATITLSRATEFIGRCLPVRALQNLAT